MILDTLREYEHEGEQIASALSDSLPPTETALLYGSVSRAFGPFTDIDVITLGPERQLNEDIHGDTPVQEHVFSHDDILDYLVNSPRGQHTLVDGVLIHPDGDYGAIVDVYRQQKRHLAEDGRIDFLALMLAEQAGDTSRPDVNDNQTHYALKRRLGGKRAYTRSYSMSQMLMDDPQMDGTPSQRAEGLLDAGLIDLEDYEAIFAMNRILFDSQVRPPSIDAWHDTATRTADWSMRVAAQADTVMRGNLDSGFLTLFDSASGTSAAGQEVAVEFAEESGNEIRSRTLLWKLMSNPDISADVLHRAWEVAERQPRQLRELGCCAVQLRQFAELDIDPASPLLDDADVQFSLNFSKSPAAR